MTPNIPTDILNWAADFWDAHLDTEEVQMVALAFMAGQAAAAAPLPRPAGMTERQSDVYAFIRCFSDQQGYSPSYQQIATAIGVRSKSRVHELIDALEERGLLRRLPGRARSLSINIAARV